MVLLEITAKLWVLLFCLFKAEKLSGAYFAGIVLKQLNQPFDQLFIHVDKNRSAVESARRDFDR